MSRNNKKQSYNIPKHEIISKYPEYWRLVEYISTPTPLRKPSTLAELAKEISVHATTLSRWQACPEFFGDVRAKVRKHLRNDLADIFYALKRKIYADGDAREVKLYLQWADDFVEKTEATVKSEPTQVSQEVQSIIEDFEKKLREQVAKKKA